MMANQKAGDNHISLYYGNKASRHSTLLDPIQHRRSVLEVKRTLTLKAYLKQLKCLQLVGLLLVLLLSVLQAIALATNDWFVLNVNEYIPTSKGGLWYYCYIATNNAMGHFSCLKYEELPNLAVFISSRLYDSRILLLCSCGFSLLLVAIELFGLVCLSMAAAAEKKGNNRSVDLLDAMVARTSSRWRYQPNQLKQHSQPSVVTQSHEKSKVFGGGEDSKQLTSNSAKFTTSIVLNANQPLSAAAQSGVRTIKPTGYFAYMTMALVAAVAAFMDFVLCVCGFALFDAYVSKLLSYSHVFLAYRSFSYWLMIVAMLLLALFWLFKLFSSRYVITLTKRYVRLCEEMSAEAALDLAAVANIHNMDMADDSASLYLAAAAAADDRHHHNSKQHKMNAIVNDSTHSISASVRDDLESVYEPYKLSK